MADRVYPSAKPSNGNGAAPAFPATKAQLYNANRPAYNPNPKPSRSRGCKCCLYTTLVIFSLIILAAATFTILFLIYRPHRPTFTLSSLQVTKFNVSGNSLSSSFSLAINAKNPNKKNIVFLYNPTSVAISAGGVPAGNGEFPAFVHPAKNTTVLKTVVTATGLKVDDEKKVASLRSDLKSKKSFDLELVMESKVSVKIWGKKTKRVKVRVTCSGIRGTTPSGKGTALATTGKGKCKADLRIKVWKWTF